MRHIKTTFYWRTALLLSISSLILIGPVKTASADCGHVNFKIIGTRTERSSACRALNQILEYFNSGGFNVDAILTVRFRPSVYIPIEGMQRDDDTLVSAIGSYKVASKEVEILDSMPRSHRRPWGLSWDRTMAYSFLEHELIDWAIAQIVDDRHEKLPQAWHEALAYAVQIELMPPGLREEVLEQYPAEKGFVNTLEINDIVYGLDPDHFAVAAYWTYKRRDGIEFMKKAVDLGFDMIDLNDFLRQ